MNKKAFLLRLVSFYLLINIVFTLVYPSILLARSTVIGLQLTENSAEIPEFVNLATGDFSYKLPVMNVPGFNLGYSVELNYNAGIQNEQNASWVGLGWNLSAGSISRTINGHADDFNQAYTITENKWTGRFTDGNEIWNQGSSTQTGSIGNAALNITTYVGGSSELKWGILNCKNIVGGNIDHNLLHDLSLLFKFHFKSRYSRDNIFKLNYIVNCKGSFRNYIGATI